MGFVYKITNILNGHSYIGITTKTINERIRGHIRCSKGKNPRFVIAKAIKKYGIENFSVCEVDTFDLYEDGCKKERFYIKKYETFGNGYNMTEGGEGTLGHILSDESRQKIRDARKKQIFSAETRMLWSINRKGKKHSEETKEKISKTCLETECHKMTDETKKKLSKFWNGKSFIDRFGEEKSKEIILKMKKSSTGKVNIKLISKENEEIILKLYCEQKIGLNSLCKRLKEMNIQLGHSAVKRFLINKGIYNINSINRINQYK